MPQTDFISRFSYIENINQIGEIDLTIGDEKHEIEVFNPTEEEKSELEEDETLEADYKLDGQDANVVNEKIVVISMLSIVA